MTNQTDLRSEIIAQVDAILQSENEEDKQVLEIALNAIRKVQDKKKLTYLSGFIDFKGEFIDEDTYQITIPITPFIMNPLKIVHGGFTATLADSTMGAVVLRKLPKHMGAVTSEMKINYISPGKGTHLICQAKAVHIGKQLCVAECKILTDSGKLVAIGTGTFFAFNREKQW